MGELVTVAQCAWLVRRDQRAVRYHIAQKHLEPTPGPDGHMRLDLEQVARVVGWTIDPARLRELRAEEGKAREAIAAELSAALEKVQRLERRLATLERAIADGWENLTRSQGQQAASEHGTSVRQPDEAQEALTATTASYTLGLPSEAPKASHGYGLAPDARHILSSYGPERPVTLADRGGGAAVTFRTKTDAARWLQRHGLNSEFTPRTWPGWPPEPLTPDAALSFALQLQRRAIEGRDWRVTWRLSQCSDAQCVCHEMIAE